MEQFIGKMLDKMTEAIYLLVVFLIPIYFAVFLATNNVFELNKIVLFKVLVLLFLLLTILKLMFRRTDNSGVAVKLRWSKILSIPLIFISVLIITSLFSINREESLYGSYSRQLGLISYFYFFLFFILLLININTKLQITRIIKAVVLSSAIVSAYGLIQAVGHDPLLWSESTELRATSTFGQPNLLAMYILLVWPLGLYLLIISKKLIWKLFYLLIILSDLFCLFFTYSLSGWVGLAGGIIITATLFVILKPRPAGAEESRDEKAGLGISACSSGSPQDDKKIAGGKIKQLFNKEVLIIVVGVLIIISAATVATIKIQNKWVFQDRLSSLVNLQGGSLTSRYNWWQASWQAIFIDGGVKRLLLGYGPETQSEVLVGYYQPDWGVHENVNVRPDRAHNLFLDILLTTGIVGLAAYLALLYLFFKLIWRIIKSQTEFAALGFFIFFGLVSFLITLQLNFTFIVGEIYFWLFLAMILIIYNKSIYSESDGKTENKKSAIKTNLTPTLFPRWARDRHLLRRGGVAMLVLIFIAGIFYLINNQIKLLTADYYFRELRVARENNQYFGAIKMYEFIKENVPSYGYYDRQFVLIMSDWLESFTNPKFKSFGEVKLADILKMEIGTNYDDLLTKAVIYKTLATSSQPDYYNLAEENFQALIKISLEMPANYIELAKLYSKWSKFDEAVKTYELAASKLPDRNHPDINADHKRIADNILYDIFINCGDIYLKKKDYKQVKDYYNRAVLINDKIVSAYGQLANLNFILNDLDQAIWYNEKAMELNPDNYLWPANLAEIYKKQSDFAKAKEYEQKASDLSQKVWP